MALIIDGHNLIPKAGINLSDPDDEAQLIHLLQEFCRQQRKIVEVYFDQAPAGYAGEQQYGQVRAIFVHSGITADDAIMAHLQQLGKRARQAQVVSSDRQVQQAARAVHATVISSEEFARGLQLLVDETPELDPRNRLLSEEEMVEWEALFRRGHGGSRK